LADIRLSNFPIQWTLAAAFSAATSLTPVAALAQDIIPADDETAISVLDDDLLTQVDHYWKLLERGNVIALTTADAFAPLLDEERQAVFSEKLLVPIYQNADIAIQNIANYYDFLTPEDQDKVADFMLRVMDGSTNKTLLWAMHYLPAFSDHNKIKASEQIVQALSQEPADIILSTARFYLPHMADGYREQAADIVVESMEHTSYTFTSLLVRTSDDYLTVLPASHLERAIDQLEMAINANPEFGLMGLDTYIEYMPESRRAPIVNRFLESSVFPDLISIDYSDTMPFQYISPVNQKIYRDMIATGHEANMTGRQLNDLRYEPDHIRYASIIDYDARALYNLMTYGQNELFTSSYLGTFDRFEQTMEREDKTSIFDLADPNIPATLYIFLKQAIAYDTLASAIEYVPTEKWDDIFNIIAKRIDAGNGEAVHVFAELMHNMPDPEILERMKAFVKNGYDNAQSESERDAYGITAAYYNTITGEQSIPVIDAERYNLKPVSELQTDTLMGKDGIHRQLMVFTGDGDGHNSYNHMLARYIDNEFYSLENKGEYDLIRSVSGKYPVELYVNHPDFSPDIIFEHLSDELDMDIDQLEFETVIHRGHSYNLANTMPYFSSSNVFMFLGSCGGYNNVSMLLDIAPDAQMVSTKQTGAMAVNDPLLYRINESIRMTGRVDWSEQRAYLNSLNSTHKEGYILPPENAAMIISHKLHELSKKPAINNIFNPAEPDQPMTEGLTIPTIEY